MKKSFFLLDAMFLFGAVAGAAFALTFAQRPGKKLRADLASARIHGGGSAVRSVLADELRAIGADTVEALADFLENLENPSPAAAPTPPARSASAKKAWETRRKNAENPAPGAMDLTKKTRAPAKKSPAKKSPAKSPAKKSTPKTPAKK